MSIINNITTYLKEKLDGVNKETTPKGVCPNCWGEQEWEGEFYKKIETKDINSESKTYISFVKNIADRLDKITLKGDLYECETCNTKD
jgi:hypothetical protein